MADGDWLKIAVQGGFSLLSGAVGLFVGIWHAGKRSGKQEAEIEAKIKFDVDDRIKKAIDEMKASLVTATDDREALVTEFRDTFASLRQKINDVEKEGLLRYLPKEDFNRFLEEYRGNQRRTDDKLDRLLGLNGAGAKH